MQPQSWPMVTPLSGSVPDLNPSMTELVHAEGLQYSARGNFADQFTRGWSSAATPRAAGWGRMPREDSWCSEDDVGIAERGETPLRVPRHNLVPPLPIGGGTAGGVVVSGKVPPLKLPGGGASQGGGLSKCSIDNFYSDRSTGRGTPAVAVYQDLGSAPWSVDQIFGGGTASLFSGKDVIISHADDVSICSSARTETSFAESGSALGKLGGAPAQTPVAKLKLGGA